MSTSTGCPHEGTVTPRSPSGLDLILAPQPEQPARPRGRPGRGHHDEMRPTAAAVPRFNFADLIRRARRHAELSQREMAHAIGISKSTLARAEVDNGSVSLPVLLAALAVGGIDLIAVDDDGEAFPLRPDGLRDRGGRKLPAHLQARVASSSESVPAHWSGSSRRNAPVRWRLRSRHQPMPMLSWQHPGPEDVAVVRRHDADERAFRQIVAQIRREDVGRRATLDPPLAPCSCSEDCVRQATTCPPTCPCGCESLQQALDVRPPDASHNPADHGGPAVEETPLGSGTPPAHTESPTATVPPTPGEATAEGAEPPESGESPATGAEPPAQGRAGASLPPARPVTPSPERRAPTPTPPLHLDLPLRKGQVQTGRGAIHPERRAAAISARGEDCDSERHIDEISACLEGPERRRSRGEGRERLTDGLRDPTVE